MMVAAHRAAPAGSVYARRVDLLDKGVLQLIINDRRKFEQSEMAKLPPLPEFSVPIGTSVLGSPDGIDDNNHQERESSHADQEAFLVVAGHAGLAAGRVRPDRAGLHPAGAECAQGKSYALDPKPNYGLTQDEGDATQLTDGAYAPAEGAVHFHKQTVGWYQGKSLVTITVDLGADTPVAGMALSTGAGGGGVHWPSAILVAVSQDGAQFQVVGELTNLSTRHSLRPDAGRYVYATDALKCHGRYVRIVMATPGTYAFCDEIEIYRGPDALLGQPVGGDPLTDIPGYLATNRVPLAIRTWVARDLFRARQELAGSSAPAAARTQAAQALDAVEAENSPAMAPPGEAYRAVYPLSPAHERIFQAWAACGKRRRSPCCSSGRSTVGSASRCGTCRRLGRWPTRWPCGCG